MGAYIYNDFPVGKIAEIVSALSASKQQMAMVLIDSKLTDGGKKMSTETLKIAARKVSVYQGL